MTQRKPLNLSWDDFIEQKIQEAQNNGEFDNLPGFGKPMPDLGDPNDDMWWAKRKLRREQLSALPPALEIRREIDKRLKRIWKLPTERQVRAEVEELNAAIRHANLRATWGPPSDAQPLDVEKVVSQWRECGQSD